MSAPLHHIFPIHRKEFFAFSSEDLADNTYPLKYLTDGTELIIVGRHSKLVTSMLQQAAVSYSSEGSSVTYIRSAPHDQLPTSVHGMYRMSYSTVQSISYRYIEGVSDLVDYLLSLDSRTPSLPQVLIIESLHDYLHQLQCDTPVAICRLCSLIRDTVTYINKRCNGPASVIISAETDSAEDVRTYAHYFSPVLQLAELDTSQTPGRHLHSLKHESGLEMIISHSEKKGHGSRSSQEFYGLETITRHS